MYQNMKVIYTYNKNTTYWTFKFQASPVAIRGKAVSLSSVAESAYRWKALQCRISNHLVPCACCVEFESM
jgi:hypothetical protein